MRKLINLHLKKLEELILKEEKNRREIVDKSKKIGRNNPCPCGSGKKYKKCCLGKENTVEVESKKVYSESPEEQEKWLEYYPKENGERKDGEVIISEGMNISSSYGESVYYTVRIYILIRLTVLLPSTNPETNFEFNYYRPAEEGVDGEDATYLYEIKSIQVDKKTQSKFVFRIRIAEDQY